MLITCFSFCFEMWNVIEKCDFRFFFLQKYFCEFVFVIMLDHLIVYVSIVWIEFFRSDECFDESNSSNMTKATHQIWHERHFIIFDKQHFIKLDEMYLVKFIKFDKQHFIKVDERYLIKLDYDISSNLTNDTRHLIKLDENFVCSRW